MKIIEIRFKNINSLYGEWWIDFTQSEYREEGIFAITGPTGSGKSTLLDVICLALYGETPRLGRITQRNSEVMSRQTAECYAEVTFQSVQGTYRCHWSQNRARRRVDGALQEARQEISDVSTGKIIESKKSLVKQVIEEKTGMNFERFTRSILLAQGSFAAFLQASSDERSPILEQITGTAIYSQISIKVHERQKDEKEQLDQLQSEIGGITQLSLDDENALKEELKQSEQTIQTLEKSLVQYQAHLKQFQDLNTLNQELTQLEQQKTATLNEIEAFKPQQHRLEQALKVAELNADYATLVSLRSAQAEDQKQLSEIESKLPELNEREKQEKEKQQNALFQLDKAKQTQLLRLPIIKEVRALDLKYQENLKQQPPLLERQTKLNVRIVQNEKAILDTESALQQTLNDQKTSQAYLNEHTHDELLNEQLPTLRAQLDALNQHKQDHQKDQNLINEHNATLQSLETKLNENETEFLALEKILTISQTELNDLEKQRDEKLNGRLLREYRNDKEHLLKERYWVQKIASLEEERAHLIEGEPCPLCGAKDHPYNTNSTPELSEVEIKIKALDQFIADIESLEESIKKAQEKHQQQLAEKQKCEQFKENLTAQKSTASQLIATLITQQNERNERLATITLSIQKIFNQIKVNETFNLENADALLKKLTVRAELWREHHQKQADFQQTIQRLEDKLSQLKALKTDLETQAQESNAEIEQLASTLKALLTDRSKLYGDNNPEDEERKLSETIDQSEKNVDLIRHSLEKITTEVTKAISQKESLTKRITQRAESLVEQEEKFQQLLHSKSIADETTFLSYRLSEEERKSLTEQQKRLDERKNSILTQIRDRQEKVAHLQLELQKSEETESSITSQLAQGNTALTDLREQRGMTRQKLEENEKNKAKLSQQKELIDRQQKTYEKWQKLHLLIGSADGKKYRNFAQGITFEVMIAHANQQLMKMNDRYLLVPDAESPLELNVIDQYQAGEVRSTKNLSGGESFIVSLALALGLSKMSSEKIRVDSLFLDEGFGTLDEEALDMALTALSGLQQEEKLIGVISHVSALKERIMTQINVVPTRYGRSELQGVGVNKIS